MESTRTPRGASRRSAFMESSEARAATERVHDRDFESFAEEGRPLGHLGAFGEAIGFGCQKIQTLALALARDLVAGTGCDACCALVF